MSSPLSLYWWDSTGPGNFGDILTPSIFDYFDIPYEYSLNDYNAICIGSIAKQSRPGTLVLGSGIMGHRDQVCPAADWQFVRGPYTRRHVIDAGGTCPKIFGDPAMLLPLLCDESTKEHDVGFIPHFSHYKLIKELYPNEFVINLRTSDPLATAREITKCRSVISSSLHGIICAHAYGIPAAWVKFDQGIKGDGTKFWDHYASLDLDAVASTVKDPVFTTGKLDLSPIIEIFKSLR